MYESFYGLREKPFSIAPDPAFLYQSAIHEEALANLRYGIREGKGFIVLTGEVGTGKTLILHALLESLGPEVRSAYIFYPKISFEHLLRLILNEFEQPIESTAASDMLIQLNEYLIERFRNNESTVLIIDEAQDLDEDLLENIRLLSNLETSKSKLLTIVLVGQPELHNKLSKPELRQLRQRVVVRFHMMPLDRGEVKGYIHHRLRAAGGVNLDIFNDRAISKIASYSEGVPRLINILCDNALLLGFAEEESVIGGSVIDEVIADLEGGALATAPGKVEKAVETQTRKRALPIFAVSAAVILALVMGALGGPLLFQWMREDAPRDTRKMSETTGESVENQGELFPGAENREEGAKTVANSDNSVAPGDVESTDNGESTPSEPLETPKPTVSPPTETPLPPTAQPTDTPTFTPSPTATLTPVATTAPTAEPSIETLVATALAERLQSPTPTEVPTVAPVATPEVVSASPEAIPVKILTPSEARDTPGAELAIQVACFVTRERARECLRLVKRLGAKPLMAEEIEDEVGVPWVRVFATGFKNEDERDSYYRKAISVGEIRDAQPFKVSIVLNPKDDGAAAN